MPLCDCGEYAARVKVLMAKGNVLLENPITTCAKCAPGEFSEPFVIDRLVTGPEAYPHLYKKGADGVYRPTDEFRQDTEDQITKPGPSQEAVERKRATRRTTPLTPEEIKESDRIWRQRLNSTPSI
jgi:hypothetical protein